MKFYRYISLFVFAILMFGNSSVYAQSYQDTLYTYLTGQFIIKERPEDFKLSFVWFNIPFENPQIGTRLLYHKRVLAQNPSQPLVQLLMQADLVDDLPVIRYYALSKEMEDSLKTTSNPIPLLESLQEDDVVQLSRQTISFTVENGIFRGAATYPTRFRQSDYGTVEMQITKDEIYNWTRYFKQGGTLVYGPQKQGYRLKRSE